jgi:hypothetical protein
MRCAAVREQLAAFLYGDLGPEDSARVQEHLASCAVCRREEAALAQLRQLLDGVPAPPVPDRPVDLPGLYRQVAAHQAARLRRWRRSVLAACAAAAALVALVLLPHFELRVEGHQLTLRWGATPASPDLPAPQPAPIEIARGDGPPAADVDKRLKIMGELLQIVASDVEKLDDKQRKELALIRIQLRRLQERAPGRPAAGAGPQVVRDFPSPEPDIGEAP